ncbi:MULTISPECIES: phosphatase PAP2 family protein [unclassified Stenotrophomonas]|uniref:phosphatase PAP2 family protein n=1 Tax=unclassified Stenotrophomonas TaxID=196198 RepID=UPI002016D8CD|nr:MULTISPECIES: phosphatase PAP2 family protein [unclassified Stenotrophomonas]
MAAVLLIVGWRTDTTWYVRWALALSVVGLTVLASKLAFLGWGIGVARLDFTGFSGHAAMSAAVWPMVMYVAVGRSPRWAALLGFALAAAIGYSRIPLNAHSWSEIGAGLALGALGTAWVLGREKKPWRLPAHWVALALLLGGCVPLMLPQLRTHQAVVELAKMLSGAAKEFDRSAIHGKK